ncbi:hypothetical protein GCM10010174_83650 [Kutzneria viridogrisea]|uniref:Uncharacterized protein n=2 Tax=Kutzneria TaxID=43356 RepID=W5WHD4_9PSEU|nr:hypothetical protein [Kutzneria albida]AHI00258.1 hypothetical protein KALB_6899 [Kutzneria albida DSM 43870]MBA8925434.1 hypothetical protein [Kutzneria viridogrisea]
MVELTVAAVAVTVVNEGIKFLYNQVTEAVRRWRERAQEAPPQIEPPEEVFEPGLAGARIDPAALPRHEQRVDELIAQLAPYALAGREITAADPGALELADALRVLVEELTGRRITFRGERREGEVRLHGIAAADHVDGALRGVRVAKVRGGTVLGEARAGRVGATGSVAGVEANEVG